LRQAAFIVIALALAAGLGALWMHSRDGDREALDKIDLLNHRIVVKDTQYHTDTLYFDRKLKVEVALHDTVVKHLTDTVLVRAYIAAAETTIAACQSVVLTCEQRVAQRDSLIRLYKSLKPSRISLGIQATCGYGLGGKGTCVIGLGGSFALTH
jgi:hypothetical protein